MNPYQSAALTVTATVGADASASVHFGEVHRTFQGSDLEHVRQLLIQWIIAQASSTVGQPVGVHIDDPEGRWELTVTPDGQVHTITEPSTQPASHQASQTQAAPTHPSTEVAFGDTDPSIPVIPSTPEPTQEYQAPQAQVSAGHGAPQPQASPEQGAPQAAEPRSDAPVRRRDLRQSFLVHQPAEAPASTGFRGTLNRIGIRTQPSEAERAYRNDVDTVSQHWPGVRTIAIVNGKGGANKTPTTALLSAVFARYSGAATLAWDNNETRGTLGWRTQQGKHEATVQDLLPAGESLLEPGAKAGDIAHYVHHQAGDKYDVLRSNPKLLSAEQRLTDEDVELIHDVAARYYRLILIDSGNDESAPHWLRMIDKADQLVVATVAKPEHAEAGALLLDALRERDEHSAQLASDAVVVVSQARERDADPTAAHIAEGFKGWVREAVSIPYDRAMVESVLMFDSLRPVTKRAWLRAGAAVAGAL